MTTKNDHSPIVHHHLQVNIIIELDYDMTYNFQRRMDYELLKLSIVLEDIVQKFSKY